MARVHSVYERLVTENIRNGEVFDNVERERSPSAVTQRARVIKAYCIKFQYSVQRINLATLTGNRNDEDNFRAACALHNGNLKLTVGYNQGIYRYLEMNLLQLAGNLATWADAGGYEVPYF